MKMPFRRDNYFNRPSPLIPKKMTDADTQLIYQQGQESGAKLNQKQACETGYKRGYEDGQRDMHRAFEERILKMLGTKP